MTAKKTISKPVAKKATGQRLDKIIKKNSKKLSGRELIERGMADRTFI